MAGISASGMVILLSLLADTHMSHLTKLLYFVYKETEQ
jgi:hypothetical protein